MQFSRSGNIYITSKNDTGWTKPSIATFSGNNLDGESCFSPNGQYQNAQNLIPEAKGNHPFVAPDESYIIYGRNNDLYIIYSESDSTWTKPIKLNDNINTSA